MEKQQNFMCEGPILPAIIKYSLPIMLTGALQILFNAADIMVVGRYCNERSVAAVGSTTPMINLIVNFFLGFSVGVGIITAQNLGAANRENVSKTVHTAFPLAVLCGAVVTILGLFFSKNLLEIMATPESVLSKSVTYVNIYFIGAIPMMVYNFGASILRSAGDSVTPLVFLGISGVLNVILNIIFVALFNMDVAGVALATTISQTVSCILVVISLIKRNDDIRLSVKLLCFNAKIVKKIFTIGLPAGVQSSLFSISNMLIQSSINGFGDIAMSGNAAAQNIDGMIYVIMNAVSQTATNFTGQNVGAKNYRRVRQILFYCTAYVTFVGVALGVIVYIFAEPLLNIFIPGAHEAIGYGITRTFWISLPYFLCGIMEIFSGSLRGMGYSVTPMIITVFFICVFRVIWIMTVFKLPQYHIIDCVYASYPLSWLLALLALIPANIILFKHLKKSTS